MVEKTYLVCDLCDKHELWDKNKDDVLRKPIKNFQILFDNSDLCKKCVLEIVKVLRDALGVDFEYDYAKELKVG